LSKPLVVVVNGTADEGYWSARYLMETGRFRVRATARRTGTDRVARLEQLEHDGERCEVAVAATSDREALIRAFDGASAIYGTSVYNVHAKHYRAANPEEREQAHAVVEAAVRCATLEHFVWQTMTRSEIPPEELGLESPIHFRTKWHFEEIVKDAGLPWTFLRQPAYMRQLKFGMQFKDRLVYPYPPDTRLCFVAEEDLGKLVAAIISDPETHLHRAVNAVSEVITPTEIAARAHAVRPEFRAHYRQASWIENAFFNYVVAGLKPAYRYPSQVNANLRAGNYFAMTADDRAHCAELVSPLKLSTLEDWLQEHFTGSA